MNNEYKNVINELQSSNMFYINPGLERVEKVLYYFGNPQDYLKYIHVAGTNGKGSLCAILESILRQAGYKTGLYTSPHIYDYTERIKISGRDISKKDFVNLFNKIHKVAISHNIKLTEFEIITIIMFLHFKKNDVEIVLLETGLGGRLDATNVIKTNLCSAITEIDLDHTDRLGDTKEKIAYEKAGIIKTNSPIYTYSNYKAIRDKAIKTSSKLHLITPKIEKKYIQTCNLKGKHQIKNLALALKIIKDFFPNIKKEIILDGLGTIKHPFRFEYFPDKNLIIDVSHNPNGIKALRQNLDLYYPNDKRRFIFGALKTKEYALMMKELFKEDDEIYLCEFSHIQACNYEDLQKVTFLKTKKYNTNNILTTDKLNIICGSFYMLKEIFPKIY